MADYECRYKGGSVSETDALGQEENGKVRRQERRMRGEELGEMKQQKTVERRLGAGRGRPDDALGANSEIGRKLKQYYDGLISDEVPDRFTQLLNQLEENDESEKQDNRSRVDGE